MSKLHTLGLHHVAVFVTKFDECLDFYTRVLGMIIEWHPDPDNVYLSSGNDNLALHRQVDAALGVQRLDHLGFIIPTPEMVHAWYDRLQSEDTIQVLTKPKLHRDGATSFYCLDPDGIRVQMIYHPPLEGKFITKGEAG
jgi:catechol 2,3-dioxygenase-like lactoylglutathione lyase family enzyme